MSTRFRLKQYSAGLHEQRSDLRRNLKDIVVRRIFIITTLVYGWLLHGWSSLGFPRTRLGIVGHRIGISGECQSDRPIAVVPRTTANWLYVGYRRFGLFVSDSISRMNQTGWPALILNRAVRCCSQG